MSSKKRRAFTLTELLVVVVIIGVLSAVVLPKFTKVLETRKTTEAEAMMAAVRNEQESRCSISKNYRADLSKLASLNNQADTKNYKYEDFEGVGVQASAKGSYAYNLRMPSYVDGRICCDGEDCEKLNKNYPTCDELQAKGDYVPGNAQCEAEPPEEEVEEECTLRNYTKTCQEEGYGDDYTGSVSYTVNEDCSGYDKTDSCTKTVCALTDYTKTCQEEGYGDDYTGSVTYTVKADCSGHDKTDTCTRIVSVCPGEEVKTEEQDCGCGGKQTRQVVCMGTADGAQHWVTSNWGVCSKTCEECNGTPENKRECIPGQQRQGAIDGDRPQNVCSWLSDWPVATIMENVSVEEQDDVAPDALGLANVKDSNESKNLENNKYVVTVDMGYTCSNYCRWIANNCPRRGGGGGGGGRGGEPVYFAVDEDQSAGGSSVCDHPCTALDLAIADCIIKDKCGGMLSSWSCGC